MPLKKFPLEPAKRAEDPIQFALGDQTFTCLDEAPAVAIHALGMRSAVASTFAFIRGVLVPEDEDRFDRYVARKDIIVGEEVLGDVLRYLSGEYAARPTRRSTSSLGGPLSTNDGSEDSSSSAAEAGH